MTVFQNIKEAFTSIRGNITRTVITCMIISIGIMALVGILTAIDGIESSLVKNFSFMGANSFNIQNRNSGFSLNRKRISHTSRLKNLSNALSTLLMYLSIVTTPGTP
jgi:putative ABC transport system permease protein